MVYAVGLGDNGTDCCAVIHSNSRNSGDTFTYASDQTCIVNLSNLRIMADPNEFGGRQYIFAIADAQLMLETGLMSILLLLVQIWDAINDPIIGAIIDADTKRYKRGKFKTYILIGSLGLIVGGAAVFLPFPNASTVVKAALFIIGYVIWDAAYTMANVPYDLSLFH